MSEFIDSETGLDDYEPVAKVVVIGVGGAGSNAVNRMIDDEIRNVEFYVCNTDKQALSCSKAPHRIVLGGNEAKGLGAGGDPEMGRKAAEASLDAIKEIVKDADMVFIAAGMGKGTGTGASPVIAKAAKEAGCLTVAIVTRPFYSEGSRRIDNSIKGLTELKGIVDSLIIVSNDRLMLNAGNSYVDDAYSISDGVLAQSVRTIADMILVPAHQNIDFADVRSTLENSGITLIGYGEGEGQNKSVNAVKNAINSPLIEASLAGARRAICFVTAGTKVTLYEAVKCMEELRDQSGGLADIKFGMANNNLFEDKIMVSIIATDFKDEIDLSQTPEFVMPEHPEITLGHGPVETAKSAPQEEASPVVPEDDGEGLISSILPGFLSGNE